MPSMSRSLLDAFCGKISQKSLNFLQRCDNVCQMALLGSKGLSKSSKIAMMATRGYILLISFQGQKWILKYAFHDRLSFKFGSSENSFSRDVLLKLPPNVTNLQNTPGSSCKCRQACKVKLCTRLCTVLQGLLTFSYRSLLHFRFKV